VPPGGDGGRFVHELRMAIYLRTDEQVEATASLETAGESAARVAIDVYQWRWVVLALHNALQGFMVIALRGSDGLAVLPDSVELPRF
jgi:hypothetical protein